MSYTKKEIENAYDCRIDEEKLRNKRKLYKAYDIETGEFICDGKTLKEMEMFIPCAKMEHMYG